MYPYPLKTKWHPRLARPVFDDTVDPLWDDDEREALQRREVVAEQKQRLQNAEFLAELERDALIRSMGG